MTTYILVIFILTPSSMTSGHIPPFENKETCEIAGQEFTKVFNWAGRYSCIPHTSKGTK